MRSSPYDFMDFLKTQYPPKLIRDKFNLTHAQIEAALSYYIETNKDELEAEYQQVLQKRAEIRQHWENRNREHLASIATIPRQPRTEALWAKLEAQKAQRNSEKA